MKIIWTPLALQRADEMTSHIALDNPSAALVWLKTLFAKVERLLQFPESGRMVPESGRAEIREILHGNCRIIYRFRKGKVVLLTLRHSRRLFVLEGES
jgi:plasmid stabilization system protein ParE